MQVSIHAPARGATAMYCPVDDCMMEFQSTLPRGERPDEVIYGKDEFCFNPRSREGSDKNVKKGLLMRYGFNPRSREGSDELRQANGVNALRVSIHAPARGATQSTKSTRQCRVMFQSTLPRGERRITGRSRCLSGSFNPRSREGSDPRSLY